MLKKVSYGVAILSLAFIGAGVVAVMEAQSPAKAPQAAKSPTGFTIGRPVTTPLQLPLMTRDDLVTRGHADDKAEIEDLFFAYIFYHDSHNGPGIASLFTKDGVLETLRNNGGKTIEQNAASNGCINYGQDRIGKMFGNNPLPFPGHSHNQASNVIVTVHGDTATLYANWTTIRSNDDEANGRGQTTAVAPNTAVVSHNGEYVSDLRRTPDGWRFTHHRVIEDEKVNFGHALCE